MRSCYNCYVCNNRDDVWPHIFRFKNTQTYTHFPVCKSKKLSFEEYSVFVSISKRKLLAKHCFEKCLSTYYWPFKTRSQLKGPLTYFSLVAKDISTSGNFRAKKQLCHPSPGQSIFALIKTVY